MNIPTQEPKIHTPLLFNFAAYQDQEDKTKIDADEKRINELQLGDFVRLMTIQKEYFWVQTIISNNNEIFTGRLGNLNNFIRFHRNNIAGIMTKTEAEFQAKQSAENFKKWLDLFNE